MSEAAIVVVFLLLSVGGGLLLWAAVDSEKRQRRVMDRESAEQVARRDTDDGAGETDDETQADDQWGTAGDWGRNDE